MRIVALLFVLLSACSSSDPAPAPPADAETDAGDAPVDMGPTDPCKDQACAGGTTCDPLDGVCKKAKDPQIGGACTDATGCTGAGKKCVTDAAFAEGYCTLQPCSESAPCPTGATCAKLGAITACWKQCEIDGECRGGIDYKCTDVQQFYVSGGSRKVCYLPSIPCSGDADCPTPQHCTTASVCK
jgi:hypothetical protein